MEKVKKEVKKTAKKVVASTEAKVETVTKSPFWGKLGTWVKEKVDCCLE